MVVWGFGVLFLSCVSVSVSGVLFSVNVCVCDLLIFLHELRVKRSAAPPPFAAVHDLFVRTYSLGVY